jgi:hypothetical protein
MPPRVVVSTSWISPDSASATCLRPDLQQQPHAAVGELLGAEKAGQRRQHDQEREQRHQRRQRDMACDRPAVIGKERIERLHHDEVDVANEPHISPRSGYGDPVPKLDQNLILLD